MIQRQFLAFVAALACSLFSARGAQAQCTNILDPGYTTGSFTFITAPVHAQTFTPTSSGTVCEIRYGVDTRGGMTAYNVYVVLAPGVGAPPTNYVGTNLFSALNQTSFNTLGSGGIDGKVLVTNGLTLTAGTRYALIIEPIGGQMAWRGNNGNPYVGGQGWFRSGASWVNSVPADFTFRIFGLVPPPNNNNCNSCQPIGLGSVNGTLVGATNDGASVCGGAPDVWYCFTAPCAGTVIASTCTTSFDSIVSVHTGCPGTEIACNDDCPGTPCLGPGSCVAWSATCGVTYRIRVASFTGTAAGTFTLTLTQPVSAPSNNNIASAIAVGNVTNLPFSTCGATTDGPGPCPDLSDIWYTYTPTCQGTVSVDLCGSSYDTYLAVYTGIPGNLTLVPGTCNDDNGPLCAGLQSSVRFPANPCTTYYIRVGGYAGQTGCGDMTISCSTASATNDQCSGAIPIGPGVIFGTTIGATPSLFGSLIPGPCGASANSRDVWYSYTPPCNGQLTIDTCPAPCMSARYDTVLSLYTGVCGNPLNQVAGVCNDDAPCPGSGYPWNSRIVANVIGGTNYKIRVSGYAGSFGNFGLQLGFVQPALTNDECAGAIVVPCGTTAFSTCGATTSAVGTLCPMFNDVWYCFTTPNCAGTTTVSTCGSPLNTVLDVYSGTCGTLASVGCNDDAPAGSPCQFSQQSYVSFTATANTTYWIRVGAASNVFGNGVLTIGCPPAPPVCPPTTGAGCTSMFEVTGPASGTPWAFRISVPCCFDLYVPNVSGVATSGTQSTDEAALAAAFVAAINAACPSTPPIATAYPYNGITSLTYGKFSIKVRCGGACPTLSVGPAFTPANGLCVVVGSALPTSGPCSFNPEIVELELAHNDCNGNGEDDYVDILEMTSLDADGNNIPDECDLIANGPGTAYCSGDGLISPPTTPCPCGNVGAKGNGCASSFNVDGANITATGVVALDNVVLVGSGMQATGICVFLQGDAIDPNAFVFGDGITCTGGSLVRLRAVALSGGSASFPVPPETITLSQRGRDGRVGSRALLHRLLPQRRGGLLPAGDVQRGEQLSNHLVIQAPASTAGERDGGTGCLRAGPAASMRMGACRDVFARVEARDGAPRATSASRAKAPRRDGSLAGSRVARRARASPARDWERERVSRSR